MVLLFSTRFEEEERFAAKAGNRRIQPRCPASSAETVISRGHPRLITPSGELLQNSAMHLFAILHPLTADVPRVDIQPRIFSGDPSPEQRRA
jgi:hypothetical protein